MFVDKYTQKLSCPLGLTYTYVLFSLSSNFKGYRVSIKFETYGETKTQISQLINKWGNIILEMICVQTFTFIHIYVIPFDQTVRKR